MTAPEYLSVKQAAKRIGVSPDSYRRYAAAGLLPIAQVMGRQVVPAFVLDEQMERLARESLKGAS